MGVYKIDMKKEYKHNTIIMAIFKCCSMAAMNQTKDHSVLESKTKENTDYLTLEGKEFDAKIVYIYDGDTMHCVFEAFGAYYRWNCRVMGVDTPELRTKNANEKELGYKVRDILRGHFQDKIVKIKCGEFDKYGRLLIDMYMPEYVPNTNGSTFLSEWLIANKYAYAYGGGTKQTWGV